MLGDVGGKGTAPAINDVYISCIDLATREQQRAAGKICLAGALNHQHFEPISPVP